MGGKPGTGHVAVVSCFGSPDPDILFGQGEAYAELKDKSNLAVSVVYETDAHIGEFWQVWYDGLQLFAADKRFLVVVCKQDGTIGRIQRDEIDYIAMCKGQTVVASHKRPDFTQACKMVLTYKEFVAWQRCGFRHQLLGRALPPGAQNHFVRRLPSLHDSQKLFDDLAAGALSASI